MDRQEVYTTTIDQWSYLTTLGRGRARNFRFQAPVEAVATDDAVSMAPPVAPLIHSTYSNQTSETFPPIVPYARKQEPEAPSLALVLKNLALALEMKDLPNEMLSAILKELPPNLLMHCRLVNSRFRDCIHALYKSCAWLLLFTSKDHNARDLARRHFAGNLQPFVGFKMKPLLWDGDSDGRRYITTITYKFLEILLGMFPLLEHFLIDVGLDYESANALIHFLPDMRMLTTLSIFKVRVSFLLRYQSSPNLTLIDPFPDSCTDGQDQGSSRSCDQQMRVHYSSRHIRPWTSLARPSACPPTGALCLRGASQQGQL